MQAENLATVLKQYDDSDDFLRDLDSIMSNVSAAPVGRALHTDLIFRALQALEPNEVALNGRLVSKEICGRFSQPLHSTARFSMCLPHSASDAAWQPHLKQAFRQLPFNVKIDTLAAAASSGSEVNLELAWALVQPSVSLIGLDETAHLEDPTWEDPGAAAIRSRHLHLLPWLAEHGCMVKPYDTLAAGLEHCSLPELQTVWELLGCGGKVLETFKSSNQYCLGRAASRLAGSDMAKLSWLLSVMVDPTTQRPLRDALMGAAVGAAASGNLPLLRWLCGQQGLNLMWEGADVLGPTGVETSSTRVLGVALQHSQLAVARWLVDELGGRLPLQVEQQWARGLVWRSAGAGGDEAVSWLLDRGVPVHGAGLQGAAEAGRLQTVRLLHEDHGVPLTKAAFEAAASSGSVPTATWLRQAGCPMSTHAYRCAASRGHTAMLGWLAGVAGCPWDYRTLSSVISSWPSDAGSMAHLEATVRELVAAGCPPGGGTDDTDSVGWAARKCHLALVRYLHEELGLAFAHETLAQAACGGCEPVLEWLVGAGCVPEGGTDLEPCMNPYTEAGRVGDVDTMACMRRLGVPWAKDELGCAVAREVPLPSMRWMVEQGAPWDEDAVRDAMSEAYDGFRDTIAWFEARLASQQLVDRSTAAGQTADG